MSREGLEIEAVNRLTDGISPERMRAPLVQCLTGEVSASSALAQLLLESENPGQVRALIDEITRRAATISRAGDRLVHDRVDELTQLLVDS
jgi:hypothetical protein